MICSLTHLKEMEIQQNVFRSIQDHNVGFAKGSLPFVYAKKMLDKAVAFEGS